MKIMKNMKMIKITQKNHREKEKLQPKKNQENRKV